MHTKIPIWQQFWQQFSNFAHRDKAAHRDPGQMSNFETDVIERVLYVNAAPNDKGFTIGVETKAGRRLAFGISGDEASKIVNGITRTGLAVGKGVKGAVAANVDAIDLDADALGRAVLMTLRAG